HVGVEKVCKDRDPILDHRLGRERKQDWRWSNRIESWSRIERIERQLSRKKVLRECVIKQTPTRAHDGLALSVQVPRDSQTRREVVPIAIVQAWQTWRAHLHKTRRRIEVTQQVVLLVDHAEVIPAQSEVEGDVGAPAKCVLQISCV